MTGRTPIHLALVLVVFAVVPRADRDSPDSRTQCIATLEPDTVLRGAESAALTYGLSEDIGTVGRVTAPADSRITVSGIDPANTQVTLNTQSAELGDWELTFHGANDLTCAGMVHVKGMEDGRD